MLHQIPDRCLSNTPTISLSPGSCCAPLFSFPKPIVELVVLIQPFLLSEISRRVPADITVLSPGLDSTLVTEVGGSDRALG